jgi:hypothetical protein
LHKKRYDDQWNRIEDQIWIHTARPTLFLTKVTMEDRHPPQQMLLGKVVVYLQKTEREKWLYTCRKLKVSLWLSHLY